jgi:hypothetical protein
MGSRGLSLAYIERGSSTTKTSSFKVCDSNQLNSETYVISEIRSKKNEKFVLAGPVRIRIPYFLGSAWSFSCREL